MRISDWSSDVCSSDLLPGLVSGVCVMASALRLRLAQCMRSIPGDRLQTVEAIQQDGLPCYAFQFVRGDALTCVPGGSQAFCVRPRSEEHTSELQSLMRISYAVFCLKKKKLHKSN